ncbi:D-alanyl-D-alanine carboxypeptidase/D-alanyl-D-alanine-endopeptidase [Bacillus sp. AFS073361]|uniref:D-alanyl-D-alanine carboxypeptidase/D-alanyl-D-alanine endopeptidase n=1 Tax=Bacillus sp. AFS073361 TaxID=2033511 RepID=UPI000BF3F0F7|nr:D-alanyl-D-alanine carboxypeptidase/D-alanyl-D-alanine-endopeptidase [Bacillus sp. AFS073361]PFP28981.1 D-alanyl-D-alanine carboxypeptidase/D-alanyl-D-alanine-endopeptidase [Bacillus sp. AFS073361]
MSKRFKYYILILILMIPSSIKVNAMYGHEKMVQQMDQLINNELALKGAIAGVSIRSAEDGKIIYSHQGDVRLRPASNMKLLTAAAALHILGEDYTFTTEIYTDGALKKKTLNGNLYLKGKGDPTLLKSDFDQIAVEIKKHGIKKINGNIVGDDTWYDGVRYSLDLPWSDETTHYGAQISALTASPTQDFDAGSVKVVVQPATKKGDKPIIKLTPKTNYLKIVNHAVTGAEEGKKNITVERVHAKNAITIKGTIPIKAKPEQDWIGVWDPTKYAMSLLKQSLTEHGIQVTGKLKTGMVPDTAKMFTTYHSIPLSELMVPFMKLSNNVHAEILMKEMGKVVKGKGSWENGLEVLNSELVKFGVNPKTLVLRDGSGVSHVNLIPANQLTQLLFAVQKEKWFSSYLQSLPVAGAPGKMEGGTLRNRLKDPLVRGRVKAKTGTISTVSSISGYIKTKSGQTLIFSILLNNLLEDTKGKKVEDRMLTIIANQ